MRGRRSRGLREKIKRLSMPRKPTSNQKQYGIRTCWWRVMGRRWRTIWRSVQSLEKRSTEKMLKKRLARRSRKIVLMLSFRWSLRQIRSKERSNTAKETFNIWTKKWKGWRGDNTSTRLLLKMCWRLSSMSSLITKNSIMVIRDFAMGNGRISRRSFSILKRKTHENPRSNQDISILPTTTKLNNT